MEKLKRWFKSLFAVDVVWVEKEDGDWVKRRNFHPVMKFVILMCVLLLIALAVFFVQKFYREFREPAPQPPIEIEVPVYPVYPETGETQPPYSYHHHDYEPELPDGFLYPGPIPYGVNVADDEYWIRVIKSNFRLYLYRGHEVQWHRYVTVGRNPGDKERFGDARTPRGIFTVQSVHDSRNWLFNFRDGRGYVRDVYGPWFIRLRTPPWRGIGIHGTNDPDALGTKASDGCVRMRNEELLELMPFISINMTVVIEE